MALQQQDETASIVTELQPRIAALAGGTLVRINAREPRVPPGEHAGIPLGALAALAALDRLVI